MPAVTLTDHGSMAGAIELVQGREGPGRQADRRVRGLRRRRPAEAAQGLRAPHAARVGQRRLRQPHQALLARLPRGLLLQAARRLGAARAPRAGHDRPVGLPRGTGLPRARGAPARRRRGRPRPARPDLRARQHLRRAPERPRRHPAAAARVAPRSRGQARAAGGGHGRRALPRRRRRVRPRGAALHPVGRLAQEPEPLEVRVERVLLQDRRRDGARLPRARGGDAPEPRDRGALQRRHRARADPAAEVPAPGGPRRVRRARRAVREGARQAVRLVDAGARRAAAVRAQDDPRDGVLGLLPHRRGLHRVRPARRRLGRAGPRQRRRLARRVLPRDHGHRPDAVRPPVRAVPQPGAEGHARHGPRLRRRGPRARHQLRHREVRPRPRRTDHHVLDHGGARGGARRGSRARDPVRRRRPDREAHPRRAGPDARGGDEAGCRARERRSGRPDREGDRRAGAPARGADPGRLDPRRGRRDRRAAADRGRAAPAEGRRPGDRDPVLDEERRGARAPEDGLPRAAEPRRDRQGRRA